MGREPARSNRLPPLSFLALRRPVRVGIGPTAAEDYSTGPVKVLASTAGSWRSFWFGLSPSESGTSLAGAVVVSSHVWCAIDGRNETVAVEPGAMGHHVIQRGQIEQPLQERVRTAIPAQGRHWTSHRWTLLVTIALVAAACVGISIAVSLL
jgi:hypothetical protein